MSPSKQNSAASPDQERPVSPEAVLDKLRHRSLVTAVRRVGFWAAVALPFLHLPLLLSGIETGVEATVFVSLVAANVLTLIVGHSHDA
jgi:hypothetical protein